jgi:hypothetical protein
VKIIWSIKNSYFKTGNLKNKEWFRKRIIIWEEKI